MLLGIGDRRVAPQLELLELRRRRVVGMVLVVDESVSGGFILHVGGSRQLQRGRRKMHEREMLWILRSMAMTKCVQRCRR